MVYIPLSLLSVWLCILSHSGMCYSRVHISVPSAANESWLTTAIESTFVELNRMEMDIRDAQQQNK